MKNKTIVIYFTLFGLVFGLFNMADASYRITGGYDTPRSLIFNLPSWLVQSKLDSLVNKVEQVRFETLKKRVGLPPNSNLALSRDEFARLGPEERQEFLSKVTQYKYLARNDSIIGEKGTITRFNYIRGFLFPIISAVAWGITGIIVYFITLLFGKSPWSK